jgi:hypothetical protein
LGADRQEPPAPDDPWYALHREIDRSRRYRHPVTLIRVEPSVSSGQRSLAARSRREGRPVRRRDPLRAFVAELRGSLRSGDSAWCDGPAVVVLVPETDAAGAEAMVARIRGLAAAAFGTEAEVRLAAFPEHGLTSHALRAAVTRKEPRFAAFRPAPTGNGNGNGDANDNFARRTPSTGLDWRALPGLGEHVRPPRELPDAGD